MFGLGQYFLKDGTPCSMKEWGERMEDLSYRRVVWTDLEENEKAFVSTVWLGLNHNTCGDQPHIFETMAFYDDDWRECRRYSTEAEAREGHAEVVAEVMAKRFYPGMKYNRSLEVD